MFVLKVEKNGRKKYTNIKAFMNLFSVILLCVHVAHVGADLAIGCLSNIPLFMTNGTYQSSNITVDFESMKCKSFVGCFGQEHEDEISGDEEVPLQLCPVVATSIDYIAVKGFSENDVVVHLHNELSFNECKIDNATATDLKSLDTLQPIMDFFKFGQNFLTIINNDNDKMCRNGSRINITVVEVDCHAEGEMCFGNGKCVQKDSKFMCDCKNGWSGNYCELKLDTCFNEPCKNGGTCIVVKTGYRCLCPPMLTGRHCELSLAPMDCTSQPCKNNGTCLQKDNGYLCLCPITFTGRNCEMEFKPVCDDLHASQCENNASCVMDGNLPVCMCTFGFTGKYCTNILDPCTSTPCKNNGTCETMKQSYECHCLAGFYGKNCESNIDYCALGFCQKGFSVGCHNIGNSYLCECAFGYTGQNCSISLNTCDPECQNNGTCQNLIGDSYCLCPPSYTGQQCEVKIDFCSSIPCKNGSTCINGTDGFICICEKGFSGRQCNINIDECYSNPCMNNGTCEDRLNSYECICTTGFEGAKCEVNKDLCQNFNCNNGTCLETTDGNRVTCKCYDGFSGNKCEENINECQSEPCLNHGQCLDLINGYQCYCKRGYGGMHCETNIDDCISNPCKNNATCIDGEDSFQCLCGSGFSGQFCSFDINECLQLPCINGGTCVNFPGGFQCLCQHGFSGELCTVDVDLCKNYKKCVHGQCVETTGGNEVSCNCTKGYAGSFCEEDIDECASSPCLNNGTCDDRIAMYKCHCPKGLTGHNCQGNVDECQSNPCVNGGTCQDQLNGFICLCQDGFIGETCDVAYDPCTHLKPCQNNSSCINEGLEYVCLCFPGFTGQNCSENIDDCINNNCNHVGTLQCVDGIGSYTCKCIEGFTGTSCEVDINECEDNICKNNGNCTNLSPGFRCSCAPGFQGEVCEINADDCLSNDCNLNHAICVDGVNSYTCYCENGFIGERCDVDIDECNSSPCLHQAECLNLKARFECLCKPGYIGKFCETDIDECLSNPCKNNAMCQNLVNEYQCDCLPGYDGNYCENEIDECSSNPCQREGSCINLIARFECLCPSPYKGLLCEKLPCDDPNPCYNQATCTNILKDPHETGNEIRVHQGYSCQCTPGFTGPQCVTDIKECSSNPCNSGLCIDGLNKFTCLCPPGISGLLCDQPYDNCLKIQCENNGTCQNFSHTFQCTCEPGWTGDYCEHETDECLLYNPCKNNATCVDRPLDYQCLCLSGYSGKNCSLNINECNSNPCLNKGTCLDMLDHFLCKCLPMFTGKLCETEYDPCSPTNNPCQNNAACTIESAAVGMVCQCPAGYAGMFCEINIDECISAPCLNDGKCRDGIGGYICNCPTGFNGRHCESESHICDEHPCKNQGTCIKVDTTFLCICTPSFTGKVCSVDVNECHKGEPCNNGGTCLNSYGGFVCECPDGFTGPSCNIDVNECLSQPCLNNGTCEDHHGYFSCNCPLGFTKFNCGTNIDDCKEAICENNSTCSDKISDYVCVCSSGWTGRYCNQEINYCESSPCMNNATCISGLGTYTCSCHEGFTGIDCQFDVKVCEDALFGSQCQNNGTCHEGVGFEFYCICKSGFSGTLCEVDIDECLSNPCQNNATCENLFGSFKCSCQLGYFGKFCTQRATPCIPNPCKNDGKCTPLGFDYKCFCKPGYHGNKCELENDDCWPNTCLNGGVCVTNSSTAFCQCTEGYTGQSCQIIVSTKHHLNLTGLPVDPTVQQISWYNMSSKTVFDINMSTQTFPLEVLTTTEVAFRTQSALVTAETTEQPPFITRNVVMTTTSDPVTTKIKLITPEIAVVSGQSSPVLTKIPTTALKTEQTDPVKTGSASVTTPSTLYTTQDTPVITESAPATKFVSSESVFMTNQSVLVTTKTATRAPAMQDEFATELTPYTSIETEQNDPAETESAPVAIPSASFTTHDTPVTTELAATTVEVSTPSVPVAPHTESITTESILVATETTPVRGQITSPTAESTQLVTQSATSAKQSSSTLAERTAPLTTPFEPLTTESALITTSSPPVLASYEKINSNKTDIPDVETSTLETISLNPTTPFQRNNTVSTTRNASSEFNVSFPSVSVTTSGKTNNKTNIAMFYRNNSNTGQSIFNDSEYTTTALLDTESTTQAPTDTQTEPLTTFGLSTSSVAENISLATNNEDDSFLETSTESTSLLASDVTLISNQSLPKGVNNSKIPKLMTTTMNSSDSALPASVTPPIFNITLHETSDIPTNESQPLDANFNRIEDTPKNDSLPFDTSTDMKNNKTEIKLGTNLDLDEVSKANSSNDVVEFPRIPKFGYSNGSHEPTLNLATPQNHSSKIVLGDLSPSTENGNHSFFDLKNHTKSAKVGSDIKMLFSKPFSNSNETNSSVTFLTEQKPEKNIEVKKSGIEREKILNTTHLDKILENRNEAAKSNKTVTPFSTDNSSSKFETVPYTFPGNPGPSVEKEKYKVPILNAKDACSSEPCGNGGHCIMNYLGKEGFHCFCRPGFVGDLCDKEVAKPEFTKESCLVFASETYDNLDMFLSIVLHSDINGTNLLYGKDETQTAVVHLYIMDNYITYTSTCKEKELKLVDRSRKLVKGFQYNISLIHNLSSCFVILVVNSGPPVSQSLELSTNSPHKAMSVYLGCFPGNQSDTRGLNNFEGCISDFTINGVKFLSANAVVSHQISECRISGKAPSCFGEKCKNGGTCLESEVNNWTCKCQFPYIGPTCEELHCFVTPCRNKATCIETGIGNITCLCSFGWKGKFCEENGNGLEETEAWHFAGLVMNFPSYLSFPTPMGLQQEFEIRIKFVQSNPNSDALLLLAGDVSSSRQSDYLILVIKDGQLVFEFDLGHGAVQLVLPVSTSISKVNKLVATRKGQVASLMLNNQVTNGSSPGFFKDLDLPPNSSLYVGGMETGLPTNWNPLASSYSYFNPFQGCIYYVRIQTKQRIKSCQGNRNTETEWLELMQQKDVISGRGVTTCPITEICRPNPCENQARCQANRNGFECLCNKPRKGVYCDEPTSRCDVKPCHNGGTCVTFESGFQCVCTIGWSGSDCTTAITIGDPFFTGKSWMRISSLNLRRETQIRLQFKPWTDENGLLFYMDDEQNRNNCDFLSLSIHERNVMLRLNLGQGSLLSIHTDLQVERDTWHEVNIWRVRNKAKIKVWRIGEDSTAASIEGNAHNEMMSLDVSSHFYVGGHPKLDYIDERATLHDTRGFQGCIRGLSVNNQSYDLSRDPGVRVIDRDITDRVIEISGADVGSCNGSPCGSQTCHNSAKCEEINGHYQCICLSDWTGRRCDTYLPCVSMCHSNSTCVAPSKKASAECLCTWGWQGRYCENSIQDITSRGPVRFGHDSAVRFDQNPTLYRANTSQNLLTFDFQTSSLDGMILWLGRAWSSQDDYMSIGIYEGKVKVAMQLGPSFDYNVVAKTGETFNDGVWHSVALKRIGRHINLSLDGKEKLNLTVKTNYSQLNEANSLFIGSFGREVSVLSRSIGLFTAPFNGCMRIFRMDGNLLRWNEASVLENLLSC